MLTRFGLAPRRPGLTIVAFQEHWRTTHATVMRDVPHLTRYAQNHSLLREGRPLLPWPGFDACSEMDAPTPAAYDEAFASRAFGPVREDQAALVAMGGHGALTTELIASTGDDGSDGAVRLLTFLRLGPGQEPAALAEALRAPGRGAGATARAAFLTLAGSGGAFDAVETLCFADLAAAERHLRGGGAEGDSLGLGVLVRGSERLLATAVPVFER